MTKKVYILTGTNFDHSLGDDTKILGVFISKRSATTKLRKQKYKYHEFVLEEWDLGGALTDSWCRGEKRSNKRWRWELLLPLVDD